MNLNYFKCAQYAIRVRTHTLTFTHTAAHSIGMDMARIRKPVNVTLDPDLVAEFKAWCETQSPVVQFGRALDAAMKEFLDRKEGGNEN